MNPVHARLLHLLVSTASIAIGVACTSPAMAWESALFPNIGSTTEPLHQRAVVDYGGRRWQLPDFSYSGFELGARAPGSGIACGSDGARIVAGSGDITTALQAAIDAAGKAGGGTVMIPAGQYTLSRSISVPYRGVSILGAGSDRTRIEVPASYRPADEDDEGLFTLGTSVGKSHHYWLNDGRTIGRVVAPVAEGAQQIVVADASVLKTGQWLLIQQYYWTALSRRNDSSGTWDAYDGDRFPPAGTPDRRFSFSYLRQITAISGTRLSLDAPLPIALDPTDNPIGLRSVDQRPDGTSISPRDHVGIAGMSIHFADNSNGSGGFPVGIAVHIEGVRDGWVHDVKVLNFPRHAFVFDSSARLSITDSAAVRAQSSGRNGRGYGFLSIDSQNLLLRRNLAELTRHGFLNQSGLNSVIVYSRNESAGVRVNVDDMHHGLAQQLLWDRHVLSHGTGLALTYRGSASSNAQESNRSTVVWNLSNDGYRGTTYGGAVSINPSQDGYGILVGGSRTLSVFDEGQTVTSGVLMPLYAGLQVGPPADVTAPGSRNRNVLFEGLGEGKLSPTSLWDEQMRQRVGAIPGSFASSSCARAPVRGAVPRSTYDGSGMLVFDGDHLSWSTSFGSACPGNMENGGFSTDAATCKVNAQQVNSTDGGRYAMALLPTATVNGQVATIAGPMIEAGRYRQLLINIHPGNTSVSFDLELKADRPGVVSKPSLGVITIDGLVANRWNTVSVSLDRFRTGAFNQLLLRSRGSVSARPFWLDDISLQ